ncbi:phosphoenolpyruvate carboxykinase (ATP) [Fructilactobacillus sp. Tb1]|uniref:phosphoenolpyruvate carboxykinase (ATP) n=1 Tax=Fructilactobacillus sp. Tb1 TaxID=3422304 RepID=UPI003D2E930F
MILESQAKTSALYMNPNRKVAVLDYNKKYVTDIFSLLDSSELAQVVTDFLAEQGHSESDNDFNNVTADQYVQTIQKVLLDQKNAYDNYSRTDILASIEKLYSFYRSFLRISVLNKEGNDAANTFISLDNNFNDLVLQLYRTVEEKLQGFPNHTYRQVNAGTSAAALIKKHDVKLPAQYDALKDIPFLNTLMLRPPMMITTPSNKRKGVFSAVDYNPVDHFNAYQDQEWFCYPAKIGESLAFIYFHRDYFAAGISLANLFEVASADEVKNKKPDLVLLFGLKHTEGEVSHYHHDAENNIWVGEVPYNDDTTYFGYMKKMCLTLHNLHMIYQNSLPIHGSMVRIKFSNGKEKSVVFFGDSGAGKSESIEALQEVADDKIISIETIFDDMGSFTLKDGELYAQGTEIGAFVRLDDLSSAVAFNNMDRGIYLNPDQKNARVIIPANTYANVVAPHHVDMWVYANNYDNEIGIHRFDDKAAAKKTFVDGRRNALGTTDEVGMSTTFFANPFGPVQEPERTQPVIDEVFDWFFNHDTYIGEIYTHLGNDKSKNSLQESAKALLDQLMNS